jgi:glycogen operon protein
VRLAGDRIDDVDERGEPIEGDTLLLLINAHWEEIHFTLPTTIQGQVWETLVDTRDPDAPCRISRGGEQFPLFGRSLALLRTVPPDFAGKGITPAQLKSLRKEAAGAPTQPSPTTNTTQPLMP